MGVPPKSAILVGFFLINHQYHHLWKPPKNLLEGEQKHLGPHLPPWGRTFLRLPLGGRIASFRQAKPGGWKMDEKGIEKDRNGRIWQIPKFG